MSYNPWSTIPRTQPWYDSVGVPVDYQSQINTNVQKVISLDDAIMRSNIRNSEMIYLNQSNNEMYVVRVDVNGNKSWQTFIVSLQQYNDATHVSPADFIALCARVDALEGKNSEVTNNA